LGDVRHIRHGRFFALLLEFFDDVDDDDDAEEEKSQSFPNNFTTPIRRL
jgi:hypothetical protein